MARSMKTTRVAAEMIQGLSQPLMTFLESDQALILELEAYEYLLHVRKVVDLTLSKQRRARFRATDENAYDTDSYSRATPTATEHGSISHNVRNIIQQPKSRTSCAVVDAEGETIKNHSRVPGEESQPADLSELRLKKHSTKVETEFLDKQKAKSIIKVAPIMAGPKSAESVLSRQSTVKDNREKSDGKSKYVHQQQTRVRRRMLLAVNPVEEMDERQSNMTIMLWIFGPRFNRWWLSKIKWITILFAFGMFWNFVASVAFLFFPSFWDAYCWPMAAGTLLSTLFSLLHYSYLLNAYVLQKCLKTFEAQVLLIEASLFSFAIWSTMCFSPSAFFLALACFSLSLPYIFYDGYKSASARSQSKKLLAAGSLHLACALVILYGRLSRGQRCVYKLDLMYGLMLVVPSDNYEHIPSRLISPNISKVIDHASQLGYLPSSDTNTNGTSSLMPPSSMWSFSLYDFCLNRGTTLLIVMLKITYAAYKHPRDCAVIKTAMRAIDSNSIFEVCTKGSERPPTPVASSEIAKS